MQPWNLVLPIFIATLPLLGVILWNLLELKDFKKEIREDFRIIRAELTNIRERLATLEERNRVKLIK